MAEAAVWWVLLVVGYLMSVSSPSRSEVVLGAALSAVAGGAAVLARRVSGSSFAVPRGWAGALLRLPAAVPVDTMLLGPELRGRGTPKSALATAFLGLLTRKPSKSL